MIQQGCPECAKTTGGCLAHSITYYPTQGSAGYSPMTLEQRIANLEARIVWLEAQVARLPPAPFPNPAAANP